MPRHCETICDKILHQYEAIPETSSDLPHHYDIINRGSIYSKGMPADLTKYDWYHGNITEEQADMALSIGNANRFLVRHTNNSLILSSVSNGCHSHDIIHRSPEGYRVDGKEEVCKTVLEIIGHYNLYPFRGNLVLGKAVDRNSSGNKCSYLFNLQLIIIFYRTTIARYRWIHKGNSLLALVEY